MPQSDVIQDVGIFDVQDASVFVDALFGDFRNETVIDFEDGFAIISDNESLISYDDWRIPPITEVTDKSARISLCSHEKVLEMGLEETCCNLNGEMYEIDRNPKALEEPNKTDIGLEPLTLSQDKETCCSINGEMSQTDRNPKALEEPNKTDIGLDSLTISQDKETCCSINEEMYKINVNPNVLEETIEIDLNFDSLTKDETFGDSLILTKDKKTCCSTNEINVNPKALKEPNKTVIDLDSLIITKDKKTCCSINGEMYEINVNPKALKEPNKTGIDLDSLIIPKDEVAIKKDTNKVSKKSSEEFNLCNTLSQSHKENFNSLLETNQLAVIEMRTDEFGKKTWTCKQCEKTFISRKGSVIHLRTHTGERPFICDVCSKCFIDSSTLMKHEVIHRDKRPYYCTICSRGFNQKVALKRHKATHSLQQPSFTCKFCAKTFLVHSSLQAHEIIHSREKAYSCSFCPSRFHTLTLKRQHERVHTNERPYPCNFCPKAFKDSGTLFKHHVIHSEVKPYCCPICSNGFTQKVAVRKHIRTHVLKTLTNQCTVCEATGLNPEELCNHLEEHVIENYNLVNIKLESMKPAQDNNMKKKSATAGSENKVIKSDDTHTPDKKKTSPTKFSVSDLSDLTTLCDVAISTSQDYFFNKSHNSKRGQHCCIYCEKRYKREKTLHSHLTGAHLYCVKCNSKFHNRKDFNTHICDLKLIPEPTEKDFTYYDSINEKGMFFCTTCSRHFKSLNAFVIHLRSHTGERPYKCRYGCEKAFRDSDTRDKHEKIHAGKRPFQCSRCSSKFNERDDFNTHICDLKLIPESTVECCPINDYSINGVTINDDNINDGTINDDTINDDTINDDTINDDTINDNNIDEKRRFFCTSCSRHFNSRNGFVIHQRSHTGERPYKCRYGCEKAFGDSATRHKHERIHTGERPFECSICQRAFNQRAALRAHQVTHNGDRAFMCTHCPSSFLYSKTLRKHIEGCHVDILEIDCPLCLKKCPDSDTLHIHISDTHVIESQECAFCQSGVFTNSSEYCDHLIWHAKQRALDSCVKSQVIGKLKKKRKNRKN